jgi:lipopolysaccharide export system protein LptA
MVIETEAERVSLLSEVDFTVKAGSRGDVKATRPRKAGNQAAESMRIRCGSALLEKKEHRVTLIDQVLLNQGGDEMRGARVVAYLDNSNSIERLEARNDAYLKKAGSAEINAGEMDFFLSEGQELSRVAARGDVRMRSISGEPFREARADTVDAQFLASDKGTAIDKLTATGNAVMRVHASEKNPVDRRLAADSIAAQFFPGGQNLRAADAAGNGVMTITPARPEPRAEKRTIRAPRMNAGFFEEGNRIKTFEAADGVKLESEPMKKGEGELRVTTSRVLVAEFSPETQEVERIEQRGDFRYTEGDRSATADRALYERKTEVLSLRGKRPTGWDSEARTQADEIDYDRKNDQAHARGDVRTTYYSPEAAGETTPFTNSKSPVFVTAARADMRRADGIAVFTGNSRGWQDDNFVSADRIELHDKEKKMVAIGRVESAIYTVERETAPGKREVVPGFVSAERMTYSDEHRLVRYEGKVKARQGADRLDAARVEAQLKPAVNEVERLTAEDSVVLSQPGRRGAGDHLMYTADDGRIVLTGKSARIDDQEKGVVVGAQLTFYIHDDKISAENRNGTGRIRSTHRLTRSKER